MLREDASDSCAASPAPPRLQSAVETQVRGFIDRALELPVAYDSSQVEKGADGGGDRDGVPDRDFFLADWFTVNHDCATAACA